MNQRLFENMLIESEMEFQSLMESNLMWRLNDKSMEIGEKINNKFLNVPILGYSARLEKGKYDAYNKFKKERIAKEEAKKKAKRKAKAAPKKKKKLGKN